MKKNFKNVAALILCITLFSLTACNNINQNDTSSLANSSKVVVSEENSVSTETVSVESVVESEIATESVEPESKPASTSQPKPTTPSVPTSVTVAPEFVVYDPKNIRGLSEKRMGYGHGEQTAKNNQATFNAMNGVDALAIDMVTGNNNVYLTFDCGYEYNNLTASILDTLKEKNVKAAFFCTLSYIKQHPDLVWRMINEGHIVGNHSATHPEFPKISRTKMAKELYQVHSYLQENFGYTPKYFRFPTGSYSESSLELVSSVGYKSIFWSFAYKDWETENQPDEASAFEKIKGAFYPGSVPLLHAVSQTNTNLLPQIIDYGISQGYTFATLDDYYKN